MTSLLFLPYLLGFLLGFVLVIFLSIYTLKGSVEKKVAEQPATSVFKKKVEEEREREHVHK